MPVAESAEPAARVALVTGAASGIGAATAQLLGTRGMSVLCTDIDDAGAATVARTLPPASRSGAIRLDVGLESDWEAAVAAVISTHGRLDAVVHRCRSSAT